MRAFNLAFFLLSTILYSTEAAPVEEADGAGQISTQTHSESSPPSPWSIPFTRHTSNVLGKLTAQDTNRYATWRIPLKGVPEIFGDTYQHYNKYYRAKVVFKYPVLSNIIQGAIKPVHNILYRDTSSDVDGTLYNAQDLLDIFRGTTTDHRIKPVIYTYVLDRNDVWRFSETGRGALDYVSNHVMHSE
ncbi:hypothetical protein FRB95_006757, partial [Tulasnella sp. JGI-2019a]